MTALLAILACIAITAPASFGQDDPTDPHQPTGPNAALFEAAKAGSLEGIRAAIEAGADVNWYDDFGTILAGSAQPDTAPDLRA